MYIIEHLEKKVWKWCVIEYKFISQIVGKDNLMITNVKKNKSILKKYGKINEKSVKELSFKRACLLDPGAKKTLTLEEAKQFDFFIFGGILGDYPPQKRTQELLTPFVLAPARNIGQDQLSTDNAVAIVKLIKEGTPLEKMKFQQEVEINTGKNESILLPYKYLLVNQKPLMSPELLSYLKKKKGF